MSLESRRGPGSLPDTRKILVFESDMQARVSRNIFIFNSQHRSGSWENFLLSSTKAAEEEFDAAGTMPLVWPKWIKRTSAWLPQRRSNDAEPVGQ